MPKQQCTQSGQQSQGFTSSADPNPALLGLDGDEQDEEEPAPTIPTEKTGDVQTLATGEAANDVTLHRGQYRASYTVQASTDPRTVKNKTERIRVGDEMKRVHFYKVDAVPTGKTDDEGNDLTKVTAVFRLIDNPVPLVPIAWGGAALLGLGGGSWLLFDSAESFVEETQWPILTGAAAIMGIMVGYHTLFS
jgi:hypothetical protein